MRKRYLLHAAQPQQPAAPLLLGVVLLLLFCHCSAYEPIDKIFINCGSAADNSTRGRLWIGDNNPNQYLLDHQKSLNCTADYTLQAPYNTARLSLSEFSYSFPVSEGPKFVRLHFYSYDYDKYLEKKDSVGYQFFPRSDALFSVTSGRFTLLQNFSVSLTADYLGSSSFYRELCVAINNNQRLNLTFTPITDSPDAYALINGIEIVSMPPDLYYSNGTVTGPRSFKFIGNDGNPLTSLRKNNGNPSTLNYSYALETVYRINVGGSSIDPEGDTGMFRSWTPDDTYLTNDLSNVLPTNSSIHLVFEDIPEYAAPEGVYKTARSMGTDRKINLLNTLIWSFPVEPNFIYLVRLHFCEFQREITQIGDRVFTIIVASRLAESKADVIQWTGRRGIPTYRNYVVGIYAPESMKINLTVALQTVPEESSVYADALLNGVEVIKVSDDDGNLAGPNPERIQVPPPEPDSRQPIGAASKSTSTVLKRKVAPSVGAGAFTILVMSLLYFFIFRRGRSADHSSNKEVHSSNTTACSSSLPPDMCHHFSLSEIRAATDNFDEGFIIGVGGFGNVYRGNMCSGSVSVAVKRLNPGSRQGAREFVTEIEMLSLLRHRHLVSLIGFCHEAEEMILVYDYMSRGTLRDHLYNTENPPLPWKQRLEICLGAARGLQYLHMGTKHMIIHRDIKTTNILLDEKWTAKVSDFGLSKMRAGDISKSHISTVVKGTFGYLDPEYFRFHQLTEKSDVYSFGVVLFEVLCARPPVDTAVETEQISLAHWVQCCYQKGSLDQIIDPKVKAEITPECFEKFTETAVSCLRDKGMQRPSMNNIVRSLELALQLQETKELAPTLAVDATLGEEDSGGHCPTWKAMRRSQNSCLLVGADFVDEIDNRLRISDNHLVR